MKVLFVLTSHDQLGNTGKKTGFWIEEFAAPYYVLTDAGVDVTLASPKGGQPPIDPKSAEPDAQTEATRRFDRDPANVWLRGQIAEALDLGRVDADRLRVATMVEAVEENAFPSIASSSVSRYMHD